MLCRNGEEWRSDRLTLNKEVISPAGTRKFLPFLNTVAEDFVAFMHRQVRKNTRGSLTVDLYHDLFRFTLEGTARPFETAPSQHAHLCVLPTPPHLRASGASLEVWKVFFSWLPLKVPAGLLP